MTVPTFALEVWMHEYAHRPLRHDLSGSTGPSWSVADVLALDGLDSHALAADGLIYAPVTGCEELRAAVAAHTGTDPEHVQITTGAAEGLAVLVAAGATPGGNVVYPSPGFPPFGTLPEVFDQEPRPYVLRREDGFRLDPQRVVDLVDDRTGLVIVNTPNNPTGTVVGVDEMRAVQEAAARHGARLVIDQVQHPIAHARPATSGAAVEGAVLAGDMSKAMSLPGVRIGWLIDPDAGSRARYFDLRGYFTVSGSTLTERLATVALRHRDAVLDRAQSLASRNLATLRGLLERRGDRLGWVEPDGSLVAFPWLVGVPDARPWCRDLVERSGVLLSPGDCFGHPEHFRIALGVSAPKPFEGAIEAIEDSLV